MKLVDRWEQRSRTLAGSCAAALAAAALWGAAAAHGALPRQTGSLLYTSTVPGTPTGLVLDFRFQNPDDPSGKPHTARSLVVHPPQRGGIDTTVPPQCQATNAELMVRGPEGCPPESRIGEGFAISDTGGREPFPRYSRTNITQFNAQDEVIAVGVNENIPAIKPVDRTRIEPDKTTTNFPLFPGRPPPEPFAAFTHLHFEVPPYVRSGRTYNHTPPVCPDSGHWVMVLEFTYVDGVTETVESRSPCQRQRPVLRIGHRRVQVDRRGTVIDLRCAGPLQGRCVGALRLEATSLDSRLQSAAAAARVAFAVPAGKKKSVRVRVPAASRARLTRRHKAVVRARARLADGTEVTRLLTVKD